MKAVASIVSAVSDLLLPINFVLTQPLPFVIKAIQRKEIILRSNSPWGFCPFHHPDSPKGQVVWVSGELLPCMTITDLVRLNDKIKMIKAIQKPAVCYSKAFGKRLPDSTSAALLSRLNTPCVKDP